MQKAEEGEPARTRDERGGGSTGEKDQGASRLKKQEMWYKVTWHRGAR